MVKKFLCQKNLSWFDSNNFSGLCKIKKFSQLYYRFSLGLKNYIELCDTPIYRIGVFYLGRR